MRYLLDTHVIIWMVEGSPNLPSAIKEIIKNPENKIAISLVSLWEIAIKMNIGKLTLNLTFDELVDVLRSGDFDFIHIEDDHLSGVLQLPLLHKDPFDRLLVSTSIAEEMTFITIDENIQKYDISWVW